LKETRELHYSICILYGDKMPNYLDTLLAKELKQKEQEYSLGRQFREQQSQENARNQSMLMQTMQAIFDMQEKELSRLREDAANTAQARAELGEKFDPKLYPRAESEAQAGALRGEANRFNREFSTQAIADRQREDDERAHAFQTDKMLAQHMLREEETKQRYDLRLKNFRDTLEARRELAGIRSGTLPFKERSTRTIAAVNKSVGVLQSSLDDISRQITQLTLLSEKQRKQDAYGNKGPFVEDIRIPVLREKYAALEALLGRLAQISTSVATAPEKSLKKYQDDADSIMAEYERLMSDETTNLPVPQTPKQSPPLPTGQPNLPPLTLPKRTGMTPEERKRFEEMSK
jgi:hypothetical protein